MEFIDRLVHDALEAGVDGKRKIVYSSVYHAALRIGTTSLIVDNSKTGAVAYLIHGFTFFQTGAYGQDTILCNGEIFLRYDGTLNPSMHCNFFHFLKARKLEFAWGSNKLNGTIHYQYIMYK